VSFLELAARLRQRKRSEWSIPGFRRAAVLVPLYVRGDEPTLLFTQRSAALRNHSGQISFPGGRVDEGDGGIEATALREAEEEVGIRPCDVEVLGLLDDVPTPTTYIITPVVGVLSPAPSLAELRANADEVAEIFEVPLSRLRAPGLPEEQGLVERWGKIFRIVSYKIDGRNIWGATARMVEDLLAVLAVGVK
jgi:8-oxo-dGTP pyrophosphatase MutT (NUDIX family)